MLRMLLTFVVALPLLLPRGVCVCGAACKHQSKTFPAPQLRSSSSKSSCKCHHCHKCDHSEDSNQEQPGGDGPEQSAPCTPEKEHAPGCLLLQVFDSLSNTVPLHGSCLITLMSSFTTFSAKVSVTTDLSPQFLIAPDTPLFLKLRALLI
jgi:hypothetical protein